MVVRAVIVNIKKGRGKPRILHPLLSRFCFWPWLSTVQEIREKGMQYLIIKLHFLLLHLFAQGPGGRS